MNDAVAYGVKLEMERATPIRRPRAVVLQSPAAQANDEWEVPRAPLSLAVSPELAIRLAFALYHGA